MFSYKLIKPLSLIILLIFILLIIFSGNKLLQNYVYSQEIKIVDHIYSRELNIDGLESCSKRPDSDFNFVQRDLALNFLGNSFAEIAEVLGEPEEQGYSSWYGPHNYMTYNFDKGSIRFCSPDGLNDQIAVSILVGGEQEILGARVGMTFAEIQDILGPPAFGPELSMENMYYLDYHFGEITNQVPEVFISFAAYTIDGPTLDAFIKWEAFEYPKMEVM